MRNLLNKGIRIPDESAYYTEEILDDEGQETLVYIGSPFQIHEDCQSICANG